jgi:tetratricopeptide (TPR) repeat protein
MHFGSFLRCLAFVVGVVCFAQRARAAGEDTAASATVASVLSTEYASGDFNAAQSKLNEALSKCIRKGCSGPVKAELYIAIGMIASQLGKADEAKGHFANALQNDPNAKLPERGATPNIRAQWDAAKAGGASGKEDSGVVPEGWTSKEAYDLAVAATKAQEASLYAECIAKDKASLAIEEQPRTRLHLATCEYRAGKLKDALRDSQRALDFVMKKRRDPAVLKAASERVQQLLKRIPKITFRPPPGSVTELVVTFYPDGEKDGKNIPVEALTRSFSIDPGHHRVTAEGKVNGYVAQKFEKEIDVKEAEEITVELQLNPQDGALTQQQIKCLEEIQKTLPLDEIQKRITECIGEKKNNIVVKLGADFNGYTDTTAVQVFSPGVNAAVNSPTAGWNISGSYLLDVVSAASPDIVSYASPPFREQRHAASISGGYKPKLIGVQGTANISVEPDYLSLTGGVAGTIDMNDKLTTPRLAVSFTKDTIGKGNTPFSVYSKDLTVVALDAGVTQVLSSTSVLQLGLSAMFERGDQSKPYRHVPMFSPEIARKIQDKGPGGTIRLSDTNRLQFRPLEQLPTERDRFALAGRFIKRLGENTLRAEERLYLDSWGILASTTDVRFLMDLSERLRVWPHGRFNAQSGADFHKLVYTATVAPDGAVQLPLYRTGDRENSPMFTLTGGAGMRYGIGNLKSENKAAVTVAIDLMYSEFLDSLYIRRRLASYGTVAFDVEF